MQLHLHEADVGLPTQPLYMAVLMDVEGAAGHSLPTRETENLQVAVRVHVRDHAASSLPLLTKLAELIHTYMYM